MQLIYLWIQNGQGVPKEQDLNFWSKYSFYTKLKDDEIVMEYKANPNYLEGFWVNGNITELTVIVGRNGSGKTSLLSFIGDNISTDIGKSNLKYICIFKLPGREKYTIYSRPKQRISPLAIGILADEKLSFEMSDKGYIDDELVSLRYPCAFIHYSPLLNLNLDRGIYPIDISTTHKLLERDSANPGKSIAHLQFEEIAAQLRFITGNKDVIPFALPQSCRVSLVRADYEALLRKANDNGASSYLRKFLYKIRDGFKKLRGLEPDEYRLFGDRYFETVLYVAIERSINNPDIFMRFEVPDGKSRIEFYEFLFEVTRWVTSALNIKSESLLWPIEFAGSVLFPNENDYSIDEDGIEINLRGNSFERLRRFLDFIKNDELLIKVFVVSWEGLSSGEANFINLFSRFYDARQDIEHFTQGINDSRALYGMQPVDAIEDAVILIDEGETGMHPQWQKAYVKNLVSILPGLLPFKKIQIILTTNNPVILSDMPNENTLYLQKTEEEKHFVAPEKQSFAANIIDIFQRSFFIEGGLIGDFAKDKLLELSKMIGSGRRLSPFESEYANKLINMIGDEMLNARFKDWLAQTQPIQQP